jgi:hypothetical protein
MAWETSAMTHQSESAVVEQLFNRRRPRFQVRLFSFLTVTAVAAVAIFCAYLFVPSFARAARDLLPTFAVESLSLEELERHQETRLWVDSFPLASRLFIAVACAAGIGTASARTLVRRCVVTLLVPGCAIIAMVAFVLIAVNGAGDTTVLGAGAEDYFAIYAPVISVGAMVGAVVGWLTLE